MLNLHRFLVLSVGGFCLITSRLSANPLGGNVAAGSASIAGEGTGIVTVNQASNTAVINWQSFSINSGELTKFVQPSSSSAVLNRVLGGQTSIIDGTLSANGQVYLVNGNGILVGPGGVISTGAFTASTRDIADADFLSGNLHFTGNNNAGVQNLGEIAALGGDVVLIGKTVDNQRKIHAPNGTAGLIAGDDVLLAQKNADGSTIRVSPSSLAASASGKIGVHNSGTIAAASAELKAANGNIYALAVQNEGTIRATTVVKQGGHIWLMSDSGTVSNSGTLNASAAVAGGKGGTVTIKSATGTASHTGKIIAQGGQGGTGGNAEISGANLPFSGSVDLTAPGGSMGTLLLDPLTLTIQSGGSTTNLSASLIDPSAVDAALGTANLTLDADAAIIICSGLTWSSASVLTLQTNQSGSAIAINAPITAANGGLTIHAAGASDSITASGNVNVANFILQNGSWTQNTANLPAFTASHDFEIQGGTFLRVAGGDGVTNPYLITDIYGLQGLSSLGGNLINANAELVNNIDATGTSTWNSGEGFVPIANGSQTSYAGMFNGQGYTINGLRINRPNEDFVGLFGVTYPGSIVENMDLTNVQIDGYIGVGGVVGYTIGTVESSHVTGAATGYAWVGGVVGEIGYGGVVETSHSAATVTGIDGSFGIGGLAGGVERSGTVETSYATGTVSGPSDVGGLVGYNEGKVETSYATGSVSGTENIGGLVGYNFVDYVLANYDAVVESSYATGPVTGTSFVGGLVGLNDSGSTINTSYASGTVTAPGDSQSIGGLVGYNSGSVTNSYATGAVTVGNGSYGVGGLVGINGESYVGTVESSYATGAVMAGSGSQDVGGLLGSTGYGGTTSANFWDTNTAGVTLGVGSDPTNTTFGITGETTANLLQMSTYTNAGWNIGTDLSSNTWVIFNGQTRPMLSMEYSTTISTAHQLQLIGLNSTTLDASYILANNIDLSGITNPSEIWGTTLNNGSGFVPIGNEPQFYGNFDGQNFTINNLYLNKPNIGASGLFGTVYGGTIENLNLTNVQVTGAYYVGGLVGDNYDHINNVHVSGTVSGGSGNCIGGLVGINLGTISNANTSGSVGGDLYVGGLVGFNVGTITNTYSTSTVNGDSGSTSVGGLVGDNYNGTISDSYASGAVYGNTNVGGLIGENDAKVLNSYCNGAAIGDGNFTGGLVGLNALSGSQISNCFSSAFVRGNTNVGGLVGGNNGAIDSSFWDTGTSGVAFSAGGQGETRDDLLQESTYADAGWDFTLGTGIWGINGYTSTGLINHGLPYFQWQHPTQALITPLNQSITNPGTLNQSAYTVTFAPGYSTLAPLLVSGPALSVAITGDLGSLPHVAVGLTPSPGDTIEVSTIPAIVNFYGIAPIQPPTPPITVITVGSIISGGLPIDHFMAQFNTNAGYDTLFGQSWFSLDDSTQNDWLVPIFSLGNQPHRIYSMRGASYAGQSKTPSRDIAFGSSFSNDDGHGKH